MYTLNLLLYVNYISIKLGGRGTLFCKAFNDRMWVLRLWRTGFYSSLCSQHLVYCPSQFRCPLTELLNQHLLSILSVVWTRTSKNVKYLSNLWWICSLLFTCATITNFFLCKGKITSIIYANIIIQKIKINLYIFGTRDVSTKKKPHF